MERVWLNTYNKLGINSTLGDFPDENSSLIEFFEQSVKKYPNRPAFHFLDKSISFAEFDEYSLQMAAYLQAIGLKKGDRVAVMLPNCFQYPIIAAGILRAGYVLVNVNPLYTTRELDHQLKDSGAKVLFILENFATTYAKIVKRTVDEVVVCRVGDMLGSLKGTLVNLVLKHVKKEIPKWDIENHKDFNDVLGKVPSSKYQKPCMKLSDTAILQYTGGTTGVSKGAELSHKNIVANIMQMETAMGDKLNFPNQQNIMCALPLYHIFAFTVCFMVGVRKGAANVLIPNPRDLPNLVSAFEKYKPAVFPAVNTLFNALLNDNGFKKLDFSEMQFAMGGGMAVQTSVSEAWEKVTGVSILQGYGLSETSPVATASPHNIPFNGTIGLPLPGTDVAIIDEDGTHLPMGERGEICIRGPQVMKGYWNKADATAKVTTEDGFFRTGDIGIMDEEGFFKIVDRKKDMILVSGFNVYPNELEDVLVSHPQILEAGVIGIDHPKSGEVPKAFVVKGDASLTESEIQSFCKAQLTGYKQIREIEFIDELPKSNVGKILRKDLRKMHKNS